MAEHANLTAALAAAQGEFPTIVKGSVNPHFKSTYADLADGMGPIRPILAAHGIAYTQTFHVVDGILLLRTSLRHGTEEIASDIPISQPPKPQDFVSLTTYYRRVALFSIAGITPANEDDDGQAANDVATTQSPPRQPEPPKPPKPRKVDTTGLSPAQAVDAVLAAQSEGDDPWSLDGTVIERVVPSIVERINAQPWAEVERLTSYYVEKLSLTEHERAQVRKAYAIRKRSEVSALAAG